MAWALYVSLNLPPHIERGVVARSRDDYVAQALKLGTDVKWRQEVSAAIADKSHLLWEDEQTVYEWAAFLATASGRKPPTPKQLQWQPRPNLLPPPPPSSSFPSGGDGSGGDSGGDDEGENRGIFIDEPLYFHYEMPGPEPPRGDCFYASKINDVEGKERKREKKSRNGSAVKDEEKEGQERRAGDKGTPPPPPLPPPSSSEKEEKEEKKEAATASAITAASIPQHQNQNQQQEQHHNQDLQMTQQHRQASLLASARQLHSKGDLEACCRLLEEASQLANHADPYILNDWGAVLQQLWRLEDAAVALQR
jgi:hypothetical protein